MGTVRFTIGGYARTRGVGAAATRASTAKTSGVYASSGAASNIQDGSGDVTAQVGDVLFFNSDADAWVSFDGDAAAGIGHFVPAGQTFDAEIDVSGKISVIDA